MKRLTLGLAAALAGVAVAPSLASALPAVTTESTDLRAGPAFDFPVVDQIPSGVTVNVHGCVRGYRWCDVSWRDARGWVAGQELAYLYQGERVTIVEYGPRIGFPVIGFAFDSYWDRYYRSRSWYGERARWRTVWRDRERGGNRDRSDESAGARVRERREDSTRSRGETFKRQSDGSDRRLNRREGSDERPNLRTGRGEGRDRGESRGYLPQRTPAPRQQMDRGTRTNPGAGDRGPAGRGGFDRGGSGQGDRRN
jgi:uncharacterized protein YraI